MLNILLIISSIALEAATFCPCAVSAEHCSWSFVTDVTVAWKGHILQFTAVTSTKHTSRLQISRRV